MKKTNKNKTLKDLEQQMINEIFERGESIDTTGSEFNEETNMRNNSLTVLLYLAQSIKNFERQ